MLAPYLTLPVLHTMVGLLLLVVLLLSGSLIGQTPLFTTRFGFRTFEMLGGLCIITPPFWKLCRFVLVLLFLLLDRILLLFWLL